MRETPVVLKDTLRCHCISRDPIIIITYGNPMAGATMLAPFLADKKVYFLAGAWWSYLDISLLDQTRKVFLMMRRAFPEHQYVFLSNDREENDILTRFDMPNYFCHHNAFLDERFFTHMPQVAKRFDAVYTARLTRGKRHELARDIASWGLIHGREACQGKREQAYLRHLRRMMPGMIPLNGDPEKGEYRYFSPRQMGQVCNQARVGLCLSAIEGGNYATTEYLLCGLPVVSTRGKGGREAFLDPEISRVVEDSPQAVAQAVAELIDRRIPPQMVRLRALVRIREMREDFIRLINAILEQEGKAPDFAERFQAVFTHKMITYPQSPQAFLEENGIIEKG